MRRSLLATIGDDIMKPNAILAVVMLMFCATPVLAQDGRAQLIRDCALCCAASDHQNITDTRVSGKVSECLELCGEIVDELLAQAP